MCIRDSSSLSPRSYDAPLAVTSSPARTGNGRCRPPRAILGLVQEQRGQPTDDAVTPDVTFDKLDRMSKPLADRVIRRAIELHAAQEYGPADDTIGQRLAH